MATPVSVSKFDVKSHATPDEVRAPDKTRVEVCQHENFTIGRFNFQPGWRWSECIKPVVGTDSCQAEHLGYALSGQIQAYLDHLTIERGMAKNTIAAYRADLSRYLTFLEAKGIDSPAQITELVINDFAESLKITSGLVPSSVARVLAGVRGLHKFWLLENITPGDVAAAVKPPKSPRNLPKAITVDQIEKLLAAAGPDPRSTPGIGIALGLKLRGFLFQREPAFAILGPRHDDDPGAEPALPRRAEAAGREAEGLWMPASVRELEDAILEGRIRIRKNPVLISAMARSFVLASFCSTMRSRPPSGPRTIRP